MARRTIDGCRALVTGTSSGIGREIARKLAARGAKVVATARRADRLERFVREVRERGGHAEMVPGDITDPAFRQHLIGRIHASWGALDALINAAGVGATGDFLSASPARLRRIMELNFFAHVELTRIALPLLKQGNRPILVNIGSVLGHRAVPKKSEYCASKFALHGFSDALRAELAPLGIDLLLVSPSTTATEFFERTIESHGPAPRSFGKTTSPRDVARKTIRAIERGKHEIILSFDGKLLVWIDRLLPSVADRLVARFGAL